MTAGPGGWASADAIQAEWDAELASGAMDSLRYPELGYAACENGFAAGIPGDRNNTFKCNNVSMFHDWGRIA